MCKLAFLNTIIGIVYYSMLKKATNVVECVNKFSTICLQILIMDLLNNHVLIHFIIKSKIMDKLMV